MILVLLGYMASGKSTFGKVLAAKLNYEFIDLDDFIEANEKSSISTIFEVKGEIIFRKLETYYLELLLNTKENLVLSLGGGTPCYGRNLELILNATSTKSIYLKASVASLVNRLKNEKNKRPLVAHIENDELLTEFVSKHLFERSHYYNRAEIIVNTDAKQKDEIVDEILFKLL